MDYLSYTEILNKVRKPCSCLQTERVFQGLTVHISETVWLRYELKEIHELFFATKTIKYQYLEWNFKNRLQIYDIRLAAVGRDFYYDIGLAEESVVSEWTGLYLPATY